MKLILLPGMDGTGELFADFVKALPDTIETVVISYPENEALSYEQLEALVARNLPSDGEYVLLGESFSGPVAISLAAKSPKGLKGVILCCTFAKNPRPFLTLLGRILPVSVVPKRIIDSVMFGWRKEHDVAHSLGKILQRISDKVLNYRIREISLCNVEVLLNSIDVPMLYLMAKQDQLIPKKLAYEMMGKINNATITELDGPHMLLQVNPSESSRVVSSFVQDIGSAR